MSGINQEIHIPWAGWRLEELLGRGQFGTVYKISRNQYGVVEYAAMKVISIPSDPQQIATDYSYGYDKESIAGKYKSYLDDIIKEYQLMMKVKGNTNIVRCDDVSTSPHDDGIGWDVFIRMELLTPFLAYHRDSITEEDAIKLGIDICKALKACEQNSIIHRDIKPSNILVSDYGDYKLGDFGVSRTLENENTFGTQRIGSPDFMSPEVFNGEKYGLVADIYSLGMVMYWLLNERTLPFLSKGKAPTHKETVEARDKRFGGNDLPEPIHGSERLKSIVLKACSFRPENRYNSADDMISDLVGLKYGGPASDTAERIEYDTIVSRAGNEHDNSWQDTDKTVGKDYSPVTDDNDFSPTVGKDYSSKPGPTDVQKNNKDIISSLEEERSSLYDIRRSLLREMAEYSSNPEMSKSLDQRYRFNEDKIRLCEEQIGKLSGGQELEEHPNRKKTNSSKEPLLKKKTVKMKTEKSPKAKKAISKTNNKKPIMASKAANKNTHSNIRVQPEAKRPYRVYLILCVVLLALVFRWMTLLLLLSLIDTYISYFLGFILGMIETFLMAYYTQSSLNDKKARIISMILQIWTIIDVLIVIVGFICIIIQPSMLSLIISPIIMLAMCLFILYRLKKEKMA